MKIIKFIYTKIINIFFKKNNNLVKTDLEIFAERVKNLEERVEKLYKNKSEITNDDIMVFDKYVKKFVAIPEELKNKITKGNSDILLNLMKDKEDSKLMEPLPENSDKEIVTTISGEQKVIKKKRKYNKK